MKIGCLADEVAKLEAMAKEIDGCQCGEIRATLTTNYGDDGCAVPGIINQDMGTFKMMWEVLRHYHEANRLKRRRGLDATGDNDGRDA